MFVTCVAATGWWGVKLRRLLPNKINYGKPKETHCCLQRLCPGKTQTGLTFFCLAGWSQADQDNASSRARHSPHRTTATNHPLQVVKEEATTTFSSPEQAGSHTQQHRAGTAAHGEEKPVWTHFWYQRFIRFELGSAQHPCPVRHIFGR